MTSLTSVPPTGPPAGPYSTGDGAGGTGVRLRAWHRDGNRIESRFVQSSSQGRALLAACPQRVRWSLCPHVSRLTVPSQSAAAQNGRGGAEGSPSSCVLHFPGTQGSSMRYFQGLGFGLGGSRLAGHPAPEQTPASPRPRAPDSGQSWGQAGTAPQCGPAVGRPARRPRPRLSMNPRLCRVLKNRAPPVCPQEPRVLGSSGPSPFREQATTGCRAEVRG